jgi:hypothetical protein
MRPGQRNEFWETVLSIRDSDDPRWLGTFSHGFRLTAEAYEKVRDAEEYLRKRIEFRKKK